MAARTPSPSACSTRGHMSGRGARRAMHRAVVAAIASASEAVMPAGRCGTATQTPGRGMHTSIRAGPSVMIGSSTKKTRCCRAHRLRRCWAAGRRSSSVNARGRLRRRQGDHAAHRRAVGLCCRIHPSAVWRPVSPSPLSCDRDESTAEHACHIVHYFARIRPFPLLRARTIVAMPRSPRRYAGGDGQRAVDTSRKPISDRTARDSAMRQEISRVARLLGASNDRQQKNQENERQSVEPLFGLAAVAVSSQNTDRKSHVVCQ